MFYPSKDDHKITAEPVFANGIKAQARLGCYAGYERIARTRAITLVRKV